MKTKLLFVLSLVLLALCLIGCQKTEPTASVSENFVAEDTATQPTASTNAEEISSGTPQNFDYILVYENDEIALYCTGIDTDGVHFALNNYLYQPISLCFDSLVLNGVSYDLTGGEYGSTSISARSTEEIVQPIYDKYSMDLSELGGAFRYAPEFGPWDDGEISYEEREISFYEISLE